MFKRLMKLAEEMKLEFGVKITNTFPVDVKAGELPSEEMYMSGKSLYPLSIALAAKLSGRILRNSVSSRIRMAPNIFSLIRRGVIGFWL